jgi:hypothetical protein
MGLGGERLSMGHRITRPTAHQYMRVGCLVVTYCCRQDNGGVEWCSDTLIVSLVGLEGASDSPCQQYPADPS